MSSFTRICKLGGCGKRHYGKGYCRIHHTRYIRHGDPTVVNRGGRLPLDDHGTIERYKKKCRCEACVQAKHDADRQRQLESQIIRPSVPQHPLFEVRSCLIAFGVSKSRLAEISVDDLEHHHWSLWRLHGPFRIHCKCSIPSEIIDELELEAG